jgi:hypothetical protein
MTIKYLLFSVAFVALAGCNSAPVRNINEAPVVLGSAKAATADQVRTAIVGAGNGLGWTMTSAAPGLVTGRIALRGHTALIDVRYTPTTYSIVYKDSTNLDFKDGQIHKNYNGWIDNLNRDIRGNLAAM